MVTNLQKAEADRTIIDSTVTILENAKVDHATTPLDETSVDTYLDMAVEAKANLFENQARILHCLPADPDPYNVEFSSLLRRIISVHSALHGIKMKFPPSTRAPAATAAPTGHHHPPEIRLPTLQIPHFHGDLQQWITFRDMFTATVHNKVSISKIEKLSYLKSLVHGEAARQIQDIILSDTNYDIAWSALTDRYNNDRELLFSVTSKLFNQESMPKASAASIRELMDSTKSCMRSLDILSVKTDECHPLILFLVFSKLDNSTKELWLQSLTNKDIPKLDDLFSFLEQRAAALVPGGTSNSSSISGNQRPSNHQKQKAQAHHVQSTDKCSFGCSQPHRLYHCEPFIKLPTQERIDHIMKSKCCFNCLTEGHSAAMCRSSGRCRTCGKKHNTLVHRTQQAQESSNGKDVANDKKQISSSHLTNDSGEIPKSILSTAVVKVDSCYGPVFARALLDNCSSNSIVSESFVKRWKLGVTPASVDVVGLSSTKVGSAAGMTTFIIRPHFRSETEISVTALIMPTISGKQPTTKLQHHNWRHLENLELADPQYYAPSNVDILIGADIFWSLLRFGNSDKILGGSSDPFAVNSSLGWIIVGPLTSPSSRTTVTTLVTNIQLNNQLERFWNFEALPELNEETMNNEETSCEDIFQRSTRRLSNGRFVVSIPWKHNKKDIGATRHLAVQRLRQMEKRFSLPKNEVFKDEYSKFMQEYISLGHMSQIQSSEIEQAVQSCYIPHHYVLKLDSTTTKLRVVFDGSVKSSSGVSLNDAMMVGPVVQPSLFDIILRFRLYPIAFTSDVAKMYRQVYIAEEDRDMFRIVWRENPSDDIKDFKLNTVTYGTASAPYLATRTLIQLADEQQKQFPIACKLIKNSVYVDDLMSGQSSVRDAKTAVKELIQLGESAHFHFRKWSCNNEDVLQTIPEDIRATKSLVPMEDEIIIKTLGIYWNPVDDVYQFKINLPRGHQGHDTKRTVLSDMSKLFDPMGWMAPVTIRAKILMQLIWKEKIDWDEQLPETIQRQWNHYKSMLVSLENITIPRYFPHIKCTSFSLVGFADSSMKAYAAVIYLCGFTSSGELITCLVTSKTRVASIHGPTLPRLELNAAVLLSELMTTVLPALDININNVQAFSDSTIVLGWINSDANRWKMYVKNRVLKIQQLIPASSWAHVKGTENPADCASRGMNGDELLTHQLWWHCNRDIILNPTMPHDCDFSSVEHEKRKEVLSCAQIAVPQSSFLTKFSSLRSLVVYVAAIIRLQKYVKSKSTSMDKGPFSVSELKTATAEIIKCIQSNSFSCELKILSGSGTPNLPKSSQVVSLNPFVDSSGILRVGGRLRHARLPRDHRNPILLPKNNYVTKLVINDIHLKNFHCGPQQTLAILNQHYWVVRGRDTVRYVIKKCVICTRQNASFLNQQMGDLPRDRVNPARAFLKTGVDFAGAFFVKNFGRSKITQKVYLSVFVCLVTRALHIEVVSSLSTDAFLAALRRFISRRGRPSDIYSDCGTNFVGADRELREMFAFQHNNKDKISQQAAKEGISWHFNPPGAPHMGGLWEAGVKSIKYHLKRVISSHHLTFEEFETVIIQIEGLLNSRPLTTISSDPNDLQALTPAHFLIGEPIIGLPDQDLSAVKIGRLDRWQLLQQKQQSFWKRWSTEFITRMQQRPKWMQQRRSIQVNDVVIIKDETQPPGKWKLGRVTELHPGEDKLVRVVSLKTLNGVIKRPIAKLCILFDQDEL